MRKLQLFKLWLPVQRLIRNGYVQLACVILLFGSAGYSVILLSNAAAPVTTKPAAPSIYFSPTVQALAINATFTIQVRIDSGSTQVNAVQANFTYPTDKLTWVSTDYTNTDFAIEAQNVVDTNTGQVKIARAASGGTSFAGDKLVANMTFTTKSVSGVANLTFNTGTYLASATDPVANILPGTSAYGNATYTVDTSAPTINITAPAANAVIELGSQQTISATSTDPSNDVAKVEFYVDSVLKGTDTSSPYSYSWNTAGVSEATHVITAKTYDELNNSATSAAVNVTVKDSTAPTVTVTAPAAGETISGTTSVAATAADNTNGKGVAKTELYIDGTLKTTDTTSPYSFSLDTTTLTNASHVITVKAYDAATVPNVTTSASVTVTVDNTDRTSPTAPANLRSTGATQTTVALAWDASTDNVGVTGYRLSRNGTVIYTGTARVYTDTGLASKTAYLYSVVALDAKANVSTATTVSVTTTTPMAGDTNNDNIVDVKDLTQVILSYDTADARCDFDNNGIVNVSDLATVILRWTK